MKFKKLWILGLLLLLSGCVTTSLTTEHFKDFFTYDVQLEAQSDENKIELDIMDFYNIGSYSTGNYINKYQGPNFTIKGINFEYYRAVRKQNEMFTLLPYYANKTDGTMPGAFYNTNHIDDINRVIIEYKNEEQSDIGFSFSYSNDNLNYMERNAPVSNEYKYIQANCDESSYFRIEAIDQPVEIEKIYIFYSGGISERQAYSSGKELSRLNPTVYNGNLIDGVSSVNVPKKVDTKSDGTYEIIETKKLTFYSTDYVLKHPEVVEEASLVEPDDVAAYMIAFKEKPANYISRSEDGYAIRNVFGNRIRYHSEYSRTDGYVNSLPVDKNGIRYIELDIDIGNTYTSANGKVSRGVGRVVIFLGGFTTEWYDDNPVAVYTDDHYATFQEYLNNGIFSQRISVQSYRTCYDYGAPQTLNPFRKIAVKNYSAYNISINQEVQHQYPS